MIVSVFKPGSRERDFKAIHPNPDAVAKAVEGRIGQEVAPEALASFRELLGSLVKPDGMVIDQATVHLGNRRVKVSLN
jgi:hypothetical protein